MKQYPPEPHTDISVRTNELSGAVITIGFDRRLIPRQTFPKNSKLLKSSFHHFVRGMILKKTIMFAFTGKIVVFKMNHCHLLSVFIFRHNYLGDNEWNLALKLSIFISAWFHFVDSLVLVGWLGGCVGRCVVIDHCLHRVSHRIYSSSL